MSKADKMFEELGFKKREEEFFEDLITYYSKTKVLGGSVAFDTTYKSVVTNEIITPKLYLAITEKLKELGWIE